LPTVFDYFPGKMKSKLVADHMPNLIALAKLDPEIPVFAEHTIRWGPASREYRAQWDTRMGELVAHFVYIVIVVTI